MDKPLKQLETRVWRTYRGGKLLEKFCRKEYPADSDKPEDWISSFVEAKNKVFVPGEGISRVITEEGEKPITEVISSEDFGNGRTQSGVLIKYLDAAERLGIQVHPDKEYSLKHFGTPYGKTECWHILDTRNDCGEPACIYIGFKPHVTRDYWKSLFEKQDIKGMLDSLHKFQVKPGDTILVKAGVPHAIGAGCFLLEIQEPTDYTMRVERKTVSGEILTDNQMHYGIGFNKMLDCFKYEGLSHDEAQAEYFLKPEIMKSDLWSAEKLVGYNDTPCFKLEKISASDCTVKVSECITLIVLSESGKILCHGESMDVKRSDKVFVSAKCEEIRLIDFSGLICCPPQAGPDK